MINVKHLKNYLKIRHKGQQIQYDNKKLKKAQRAQVLKNYCNKKREIEVLEKTNPVQAVKEIEKFSTLIANANTQQEQSKKSLKDSYINNYNAQSNACAYEDRSTLKNKEYADVAITQNKLPENGSKVFNESIPVAGTTSRVGVENGKIIQFQQWGESNKYYGYVVPDISALDPYTKNALNESGLLSSVNPESLMSPLSVTPASTATDSISAQKNTTSQTDVLTQAVTAVSSQPATAPVSTTVKPTAQSTVSAVEKTSTLIQTPIQNQEIVPLTRISSLNDTSYLSWYSAIYKFFLGSNTTTKSVIIESQASFKAQEIVDATDRDVVSDVLLKKKFNHNNQKANNDGNQNRGSNGSGDNNNDDDDKNKRDKNGVKAAERVKNSLEKKYPNGIYEENPKHHPNSRGDVGKCPKDGQKALDESINVPGEKWRVAIQDNKFIMLEKHADGKYHGYIVENPEILHQDVKNALYNQGWVRAVNNLKIIKK